MPEVVASIEGMSQTEKIPYLGKAWKQALAVFNGPPGADAPPLRRLLLPQGELAQLHDGEPSIHYIAYIQLKAGAARGNHYHHFKEEYFYVLEGEAILDLEDIETKGRESIPVQAGDLVFLPTRVAHAIRVLKAGHAIEFSPVRFDPSDIYRYVVGQTG
jgi:mannose-6-phosphate isomerase-like protein (cupin superfamily)